MVERPVFHPTNGELQPRAEQNIAPPDISSHLTFLRVNDWRFDELSTEQSVDIQGLFEQGFMHFHLQDKQE